MEQKVFHFKVSAPGRVLTIVTGKLSDEVKTLNTQGWTVKQVIPVAYEMDHFEHTEVILTDIAVLCEKSSPQSSEAKTPWRGP